MFRNVTSRFRSKPVCPSCGADIKVMYGKTEGYSAKCGKCGRKTFASPFVSSASEQDWLYSAFGANYEFGRSETPLKAADRPLKVFISGPMTGYDNFNFGKFDLISGILRRAGVDVVNPVDICRRYRKDRVLADKAVFAKMVAEQQAAEKTCSAVLMLDGWEMSNGARLELAAALKNGLDVFLEKDIGIVTGMVLAPDSKLAVTVRAVHDEDVKAQAEGKYGNIPAGSRVLALNKKDGLARILWNGNTYLVKPDAIYTLK